MAKTTRVPGKTSLLPAIEFVPGARAKKHPKIKPEIDLMTAMIDRLIRDLLGEVSVSSWERKVAANYVLTENPNSPYSFHYVCRELEFSHSLITLIRDLAIRAKSNPGGVKRTKEQTMIKKSLRACYNFNSLFGASLFCAFSFL